MIFLSRFLIFFNDKEAYKRIFDSFLPTVFLIFGTVRSDTEGVGTIRESSITEGQIRESSITEGRIRESSINIFKYNFKI